MLRRATRHFGGTTLTPAAATTRGAAAASGIPASGKLAVKIDGGTNNDGSGNQRI